MLQLLTCCKARAVSVLAANRQGVLDLPTLLQLIPTYLLHITYYTVAPESSTMTEGITLGLLQLVITHFKGSQHSMLSRFVTGLAVLCNAVVHQRL
jgi:hypothetical protein